MKCPNCQNEIREGAIFCGKCGTEISIACPKCNFDNPPDNHFCEKCGNALKELKETLPVDYSEPQSYTPKFLADKILTTRSSIEGERKLVTVFFADVANYTSISEKLDPEEVHQIMDGCFKILMDEIHKYEGTINQFTGDGVMALFGAPVAHEDHAQRACYASLAIQREMDGFNENLKEKKDIDFKLRIGLNTGPVVVGSIGDDLRMDYTAVGDTTNLASRMESTAKSGTTLVSNYTHKIVKDFFEFESVGEVEIKGKEKRREAYQLIRTSEVDTRFKASVAKGLTRYVGRENSMPSILEVYEKAKSGAGQVVGIVGEAGVGKSRILLEFRNRTIQDQYTYLEGRCLHYGSSMPYLPILDILRSYFEIKEGDRENVIKKKTSDMTLKLHEKLENIIPPFQDLLSLNVDDEGYIKLEPKQKREKTFEAIRDLLIRLSQVKPLVVAIEDLHWIDKTTEEFLDYLIGWLASSPILLILLYRPEYTHRWGSKSYYSKLGLTQLTTKSSAELVQAVLEEGEIASELRDLILNRAAGIPLFVEEFTYTLLENGSIQKKENQYVLSTKVSDIEVPDTIQGIIAARMDRLEDNLKRTMQVASVIGRDFAFRILQTITGMREELKSYLLNLQGLEFIYEKSLFPELEYVFKHALTQEVAYNSLLLKRRKEIHGRIARAIEELYADRLEQHYELLAHHWEMSESSDRAIDYLVLAGEKTSRKQAVVASMDFFTRALNLIDHTSITPNRDFMWRIGASITWCNPGYGHYLVEQLPAKKYIEKGLKVERDFGLYPGLSNYYIGISMVHFDSGDLKKAQSCVEKALELSQKNNERIIEAMSNIWLGRILGKKDRSQCNKAEEFILEGIRILDGLEFTPYSIHGYLFLGEFYENVGQKDKANEYQKKAERMFNEMGRGDQFEWLRRNLGLPPRSGVKITI